VTFHKIIVQGCHTDNGQFSNAHWRKPVKISEGANIININVSGGLRSYKTKKRSGLDGLLGELSPLKPSPRFPPMTMPRIIFHIL